MGQDTAPDDKSTRLGPLTEPDWVVMCPAATAEADCSTEMRKNRCAIYRESDFYLLDDKQSWKM